MISTFVPITRRVAVVTAAVFALLAFAASPAGAVSVATFDSHGDGYNGIVEYGGDSIAAGTDYFMIAGTRVGAYCAEIDVTFDKDASFTVESAAGHSLGDIGKAAWIAKNAPTVGTPAGDPHAEQSAVQIAVWHFTDGFAPDSSNVNDGATLTRANELIAAVGSNTIAPSPVDFSIAAFGTVHADSTEFVAVVNSAPDTPVEGVIVSFEVAGEVQDVATDSNGTATAVFGATAAGETTDADVSANVVIPAGSILVPDNDSQKLVTAEDAEITISTTASVAADADTPAPPAPPAPDSPEPAPEPAPDAPTPAEELPYTGGSLGLPHLLAGVALLAGGAVWLVRMRRGASTP